MPHPNADLLRKGYDAFSKGDLDTIRNEVFSPDVVFHVAGRNPLSGDYRGVDEVFGFFGRLFDLGGGTFSLELHDIVANDGHAVGLSRLSAQREGKALDGANGVEVYHVQDGRVTEAWLITRTITASTSSGPDGRSLHDQWPDWQSVKDRPRILSVAIGRHTHPYLGCPMSRAPVWWPQPSRRCPPYFATYLAPGNDQGQASGPCRPRSRRVRACQATLG